MIFGIIRSYFSVVANSMNFEENYAINIPTQFEFNWQSDFRE